MDEYMRKFGMEEGACMSEQPDCHVCGKNWLEHSGAECPSRPDDEVEDDEPEDDEVTHHYPCGTQIDPGDPCHAIARGDGASREGGPQIGEDGKIREVTADGGSCGPILVNFKTLGEWYTVPEKLHYGTREECEDASCRVEDDEDETPEGPTLKVGDRVRMIRRGDFDDGTHGPALGETGTVDQARGILKNGKPYVHVKFDKYGGWFVHNERLEALESEGESMATPTKAPALSGPAPTIVREGRQIILPEGMSFDAGIEWLRRRKVEEETMVAVRHQFAGVYPLDALVALHRALGDIYNWVENIPTPGFFGPEPPTMVTIKTGPGEGEFISVALGSIGIPGIKGALQTAIGGPKGKQPSAWLTGEVRQGDMGQVKAIIERAEERLRESSIYRGKAIKVSWRWMREGTAFDVSADSPQFMDLSDADESGLVFSDDVQEALEQGLWTPIEHTDACRSNGVPLHTGVLLEGPPGTGKTLTALVTAQKATENRWTFVYADDVRDLRQALTLAAQYAPAVVFAEDLDRVVSGQRDSEVDEILNCLDGVDTKGREIITVLTTNHVNAILKPAIRPGRIDTILSTRPPDAKAATRLLVLYGRGLLASTANLDKVGAALDGQIPAVIREVVERAKKAAIWRTKSIDIRGKVTGDDLMKAARSLEAHAALLSEGKVMPVRTTIEVPLTFLTEAQQTLLA